MKNTVGKKIPLLIAEIIQNTEFWRWVSKLLEVIRPVSIALDILQSDSIKFGENIGIMVAISLSIRRSSITEFDQFLIISKCESRLNSLIREDTNLEKVGFCLHATAYFCHPGFRGYLLSSHHECITIAEDGLQMLLARRLREGMKVSSADVTDIIKLMLDFVRLQGEAWTMMFGSTELVDTDPIMYWCSYITTPFIGIPNKTTNQQKLFKKCMMELF